ncbi:MAG: hypothetical protein ACLPX9_10535 [Rhodomicrobium sp.]
MSVNRYKPHVLVIPEDDANRQLAVGFDLNMSTNQLQVEQVARGWRHVYEIFVSDYAPTMDKFEHRIIVLLIDFDDDLNRLQEVKRQIPAHLTNRVFILGARTEPEALKQAGLGAFEAIGRTMADDCRSGTQAIWAHELLRHNEGELNRLREAVYAILF